MTWVFYILLLFIKQAKSFRIYLLLMIGIVKKKRARPIRLHSRCGKPSSKTTRLPTLWCKNFSMKQPTFAFLMEIVLASNPIPAPLKEILTSSSEEAKLFRICIRTINNFFAITSFGVKFDKNVAKRSKDVYTFKIQKQVYHFISDLEASKRL